MSEERPVGYKMPPKHGQWKPGQSGNPSGKKKAADKTAQPIPETLTAILNETMQITLAGKKQKSSTGEAFLRKFVQNLFNAPVKQQLEGLKLLQAFGVFDIQASANEQQCDYSDPFTEEHRRLLKIIREEMDDSETDD